MPDATTMINADRIKWSGSGCGFKSKCIDWTAYLKLFVPSPAVAQLLQLFRGDYGSGQGNARRQTMHWASAR